MNKNTLNLNYRFSVLNLTDFNWFIFGKHVDFIALKHRIGESDFIVELKITLVFFFFFKKSIKDSFDGQLKKEQ